MSLITIILSLILNINAKLQKKTSGEFINTQNHDHRLTPTFHPNTLPHPHPHTYNSRGGDLSNHPHHDLC